MATVIFSNMGDTDTAVLRYIWMGMPKVKVVEITRNTVNAKQLVNEAIEQEHDTLIMCGHGTPGGLLNPGFKGGAYLIDQSNYRKIKCNRVVAVWCHAKDFAETYGVKGFWSSMFISNSGEASMNGIKSVSGKSITEQEILFCIRLNELIKNYIPMKTWIDKLKAQADYDNEVVQFNYEGLRYYKVAPTPRPKSYGYTGSILESESQRWGTDLTDDDWYHGVDDYDGDTYDVGGVVESTSFRPAVYDGVSRSKDVKVPYEPKGVGGIRKTSLRDADELPTLSKRRPKKSGKRTKSYKKARLEQIYREIEEEDEYPVEVWRHMD